MNKKNIIGKEIEVKNLYMKYSKKDEKYTLENLNFKIQKGDFHAFIGENGAGKSTTIRILTGLNNDFDGTVEINGEDTKNNLSLREGICYIPDKTNFPSGISCFDFLLELGLLVRNDKAKIKEEINYWAKELEIEKIMNKSPNKLSSGQGKKILTIRAIIEKAAMIILDEPAAFLDPKSRRKLFKVLQDLNNEGVTIFISSHILDEIKLYVNSATFIESGKIQWFGSLEKIDLVKKYDEIKLMEVTQKISKEV